MAIEQTFAIIKPDAVALGHAGQILAMIEKAGFRIRGMRMTRLSKQPRRRVFYDIHRERPFFLRFSDFHDGRSRGSAGAGTRERD